MTLDDLADDTWRSIEQDIRAGDHPSAENLSKALRRGETVPPRCQEYLAGILDGSVVRKPGRPRTGAKQDTQQGLAERWFEDPVEEGLSKRAKLRRRYDPAVHGGQFESYERRARAAKKTPGGDDIDIFRCVGVELLPAGHCACEMGAEVCTCAQVTYKTVEHAFRDVAASFNRTIDEIERAYRRGKNAYLGRR